MFQAWIQRPAFDLTGTVVGTPGCWWGWLLWGFVTHGPMVHHVIIVNYNLSGACHAYMMCFLPTHLWGPRRWLNPLETANWESIADRSSGIHWFPWRFEDPPSNLSNMTFMNFEWSKRGPTSGIDLDPWPQSNTANKMVAPQSAGMVELFTNALHVFKRIIVIS